MKLLVVAVLFVASAAAYKTYDGYQVFRVVPETQEQLDGLTTMREHYDYWTERIRVGAPVDIMASPTQQMLLHRSLNALGLQAELIHRNVYDLIKESSRSMAPKGSRLDWTSYHSYEDIITFITEQAEANDWAELINVGSTDEGRDLIVLHLNPAGSDKKIWIDGNIHAREWISPAVVTYIINELTTNYEANKELADAFDWYIIPMHNPDGYTWSRDEDRLWRKNRKENPGGCYGVDLNRNWDFHWMEFGSSQNECSDIYAGPDPDSEAEVQAVRDFTLGLNADDSVQMFLTLHSYSQVWLCPWGWTSDLPDDYDELVEIMDPAVEALEAVHGTNYDYGTSTNVLGAASGASDDWAKGVLNVAASFTIELRDRGFWGFELPPEQILPTSEETWEGIKVAIMTKLRQLQNE